MLNYSNAVPLGLNTQCLACMAAWSELRVAHSGSVPIAAQLDMVSNPSFKPVCWLMLSSKQSPSCPGSGKAHVCRAGRVQERSPRECARVCARCSQPIHARNCRMFRGESPTAVLVLHCRADSVKICLQQRPCQELESVIGKLQSLSFLRRTRWQSSWCLLL